MLLWEMMASGGGALKVELRQLLTQTQKQEPLNGQTNKHMDPCITQIVFTVEIPGEATVITSHDGKRITRNEQTLHCSRD